MLEINEIYNEDCLEGMKKIDDKSVDFILTDPPYNTTNNSWEYEMPLNDYVELAGQYFYETDLFKLAQVTNSGLGYTRDWFYENKKDGLWTHYNRIIKDNGCIALWAQSPFDKRLACSNEKLYRYEWIVEKTKATGHLNAKKMPMKAHENVLIFYKKLPTYNPQMTEGHTPVHSYTKHTTDGNCYVLQRLVFQAVVVHKDIQEMFCSSSGILRKVAYISVKSLLKRVSILLKPTQIQEI